MSRYEHGRVLAVNEEPLGAELVSAHAAGVTSLTVVDAGDFDEDGGWLRVGTQVTEYASVDDDAGVITLTGTLTAAAGEGDRVELWDPLYQTVSADLIAQVELDGDDDNADPLEASVAHHLVPNLAEGIRGLRGESVRLELDGDEWTVVDILGLGKPDATGTAFFQDAHSVAAVGAQTVALTHEPIAQSEHLYWNGLYQPAAQWTRDGKTITVPDAGGHLAVGDVLDVEYAYRVGVSAAALLEVDWSATGWRYLVVGETDTVDRSGVGFDDSTWSVGQAPFGNGLAPTYPPAWAAPNTVTGKDIGLWVRRRAVPPAGAPVTARIRFDGPVKLYWNGTQFASTGDGPDESSFAVPGSLVTAGENVFAAHLIDDVPDPAEDWTYLDLRLDDGS